MAEDAGVDAKKRTFRKFAYRGVDLDQLMDLSKEDVVALFRARIRRKYARGLKRKHYALNKRLVEVKKKTNYAAGEKPAVVKTHLRDHIITPEMIGSIVGVYNGKQFNAVEIKAEMIGHYLAEFSVTYKPIRHGSSTNSSRFIPLK